jgi:ribonucleoside-diphosphate reductase alpha chain
MRIERSYTKEGQSPYAGIAFRLTGSEIRNPDGSVVFRAENVEVPASWSQVAADVLAQKYFRKAGVPVRLNRSMKRAFRRLRRSIADDESSSLAREGAHCRRAFGKTGFRAARRHLDILGWKGAISTESDARAFFDDVYMLAMQMAAPNSPQWSATSACSWAYGIDGARATFTSTRQGQAHQVEIVYEHPQAARVFHPVHCR